MDVRFKSRKFLLALLTLLVASVLVWEGKIADGVYSAIIISTVAAYITGNVAQRTLTAGQKS